MSPIVDAVEYVFRVQAISVLGNSGSISTITYTTGGDVTAPNLPILDTPIGTLGFINIYWTNPSDKDFSHVEIWESNTSSFSAAVNIAEAFGDSFNRGNLGPLVTKYYWIRSVDLSSNKSAFVGPVSATTSQITNADLGPATIQYDNFAVGITDLFDDIATDFTQVGIDLSQRVLVSDYNITVEYQQQLENATTQLATDALTLALNASSLEGRVNDAGITVDPATGSVTIQGLSAIQGRVNEVEIELNAVEGELVLKATTSYVNSAIAAATLPEATIAELDGLEARVGTVEIDLNSVEGSITLTSTGSYYNVNDGVLGVEALEGRISINEGSITLKASQTEMDGVETRLGDAEITINSIDVPSIKLAVQDVRSISEKQTDLAGLTLEGVLGRYKDREYVLQDSAYARLSLTADVNDEREARASAVLELASQIGNNEASIFSEQQTRVSADSALASDITELNVQLNDPITGLPAAQASIINLEETKVTPTEATAIAQSEITSSLASDEAGTIGSSISNLEATKVTPTEATAIAQSEITSSLASAGAGTIGASISNLEATKVSAAGAVAAVNTEVGAEFNGISGLVSETVLVKAGVDGIETKYGVSIDNNGNASGFQLLSGASGSAFNVRADQFAVFDANNNGGVAPFTIFTAARTIDGVVYPAGTYIKNAIIDNAAIVDLSVDTIKIKDQAVTFTSFIKNNSIYNISSTSAWTTVAQIVAPRTALVPGKVQGVFTASHSTSGGSTTNRSEWIEFDAEVVLVTGSTISSLASVTGFRIDGFNTATLDVTAVVSHTSSGDRTYRLRVKKVAGSAANVVVVTPSLEVLELKK